MKVLYIAFLILHTLKVVWSYVPVIRQLTFRLTKSTKSKRTPFKSTYGNWENDPYKSPIDPYNDPYQQDTRYNDPAYSDNYFGNNYGWNPSKPARPDVDERAYRDPLYNNDTPKPNKIEYQMGPRSRVKTHYEAGLMQDGDQRGSTSAFTYGPTDQSEKPRVSTSIESPYGTPYGQDETYVSSYDSRFPEKGYYQAGVPDRQAYDYNAPPVTYGPPPSSLTYPDYTDFTFGPGSSIASKGPKPLREGEDPGLSFNGGMLFSEEERRSTSRVSRRGPPMPPPDMPPNKAYSRPYNEDLSPRPFDYGPDSSVNANRFKNEVDYEYQQGPHESFVYSPQSSFSVDGGRRYEPDEPRFQAEEPRESYNYERSSSSASRDYNVKSSSRRTNYDNLQEKEEDIPDLFVSRHKISQDIKDLMQKVLLGKRSKVPEVVQGALQARQEIRELLALSKRNLERQISKLEAMIDEMDISTSKVEACMELENLKEQLEREKQVEKDMDMEIGDIASPSTPARNLYEPEVVTDAPFDDFERRSYRRGPMSRHDRLQMSTIRSGNTTYTRSAPPFHYGPGSSIATASADLDYDSVDKKGGFGALFTSPDTSKSVDATYDGPTVSSKSNKDNDKVDVVEKWKQKWGPR